MLDDMARAAGVYAGTLGAVPVTLYSMTISHPLPPEWLPARTRA